MIKVFPSVPRGHGKSSSSPFYERPLLVLTRTDMKDTYFVVYDGRIEKEEPGSDSARWNIKISPEDFDKYLAKAKLTGEYAKVYHPLKLAYDAKIAEIFKADYRSRYTARSIIMDEATDMADAIPYAYLESRLMAAKLEEVTSLYASSRMTGPTIEWAKLPEGMCTRTDHLANIYYDTGEDE